LGCREILSINEWKLQNNIGKDLFGNLSGDFGNEFVK
jgi:hypothetical protein